PGGRSFERGGGRGGIVGRPVTQRSEAAVPGLSWGQLPESGGGLAALDRRRLAHDQQTIPLARQQPTAGERRRPRRLAAQLQQEPVELSPARRLTAAAEAAQQAAERQAGKRLRRRQQATAIEPGEAQRIEPAARREQGGDRSLAPVAQLPESFGEAGRGPAVEAGGGKCAGS